MMICDIQKIIKIAKEAGKIIMQHYYNDGIEVSYKADSSPVSTADLESNKLICEELIKLYPQIPIISEESDHLALTKNDKLFWSIDPLDGTKSYLSRDGEFTVNIALIQEKTPIIGVIFSPLSTELYFVDRENIPYKQLKEQNPIPIKARRAPIEGLTVLVSALSRNETKVKQYLMDKKVDKIIPTSSSFKICKIAEGLADLYPRFGQTMEWDTAAGHAILNAAGGKIVDLHGHALTYGHSENQYYNPEFVASGN